MGQIKLDWVVGWTDTPDREPEEWVPASVPGNVQADWARSHGWPDWWVGDNFRQYRWMEDVVWVYRTTLPDLPPNAHFVLYGVDHHGQIRLNRTPQRPLTGSERLLTADLGGCRAGDLLEVLVTVPHLNAWAGNDRDRTTTKAGVFYGWDFAPRLVPIGFWNSAAIVDHAPVRPWVTYAFEGDGVVVSCRIEHLANQKIDAEWTLLDPKGKVIGTRPLTHEFCASAQIVLPTFERWWPNGFGDQPVYTSVVRWNGDEIRQQVGFRKVKLVPYDGMWSEGRNTPGTRWEPPITVEVNGRQIFAKGANWVPPSMLPGTDTHETYDAILRQCRDAGFNLIRVWGGGNAPRDDFFDLCDAYGILVWQEFPLACGRYEGTFEYLSELTSNAEGMLERLHHHPSLAIWCGGNELFCPWSQMTDQDRPLRALNAVCEIRDHERPFLATSPLMGMAHGGYTFVYHDGREGMAAFQQANATAYTEFGSSGPASVEVLRSFIPEDELWPPRPGTAWETHCGFQAWDGHKDSWLMLPMLEDYFGPFDSLEDLVWAGQLLQAEGMRHCCEEARRQKPRCSMALAWCLNEPWPTSANCSLISWPSTPKPAMRAVAEAFRPTLLSLRISKFRWSAGEIMRVEPFVLNDAYESFAGGEALISVDGVEVARWRFPAVEQNRNVQGSPIEFQLPELNRTFEIAIVCEDRPEWENRYALGRLRATA